MIRILIADDEALEREAISHILRHIHLEEECVMDQAVNGYEALEAAEKYAPDIAFLDIRMPGMDGLEVAERLSHLGNPPFIIMVTAYDSFAYARMALRYGVLDYLLKPASSKEIDAAVRKAIYQIRRRREEAARRAEMHSIAADMEQISRMNIVEQLEAGSVADSDVTRLVKLRFGTELWSCVAIAAGARDGSSSASLSLARLEQHRFLSGIAERYLTSDLGIPENLPSLFFAGSGQRVTFMLLVVPFLDEKISAESEPKAAFHAFQHIRSRLAQFRYRCIDAGAGDLRFGACVSDAGLASAALAAAKAAFNLTATECPILVLSPMPFAHGREGVAAGSLAGRTISWLQDHFMESIGLADAAEYLNVSPSYLSRMLKKEIGIGFGEILVRTRIAHVKNLLANGIPAKEASFLVGFRDQSYFTKVFIRVAGLSPSRYLDSCRRSSQT